MDELAIEFKSTRYALLRQIQRLRQEGIPLKRRTKGNKADRAQQPWSQGEAEYLLRRRNERATAEEISLELGRSVMSIQGMIQKLIKEGVPIAMRGNGVPRKWDPENLKAVAATHIRSEV